MKKLLLLLFVSISFSALAQTDYTTIYMEKDPDYKPAEKYVLEASSYIISTPLNRENQELASAAAFLRKWMEGTPDYTYIIDSPVVTQLNSENAGLQGVYFAGMAKFSLENTEKAQDPQLVMFKGITTILDYSEKPENKVKLSESLKKLIELNKKGELEKLFKP